jgi:hypothetical protein
MLINTFKNLRNRLEIRRGFGANSNTYPTLVTSRFYARHTSIVLNIESLLKTVRSRFETWNYLHLNVNFCGLEQGWAEGCGAGTI